MSPSVPGEGPERRIERAARAVIGRPRLVIGTVLALAAAAALAAGLGLRIRPGYVDLLDRSSAFQARYLDALERFGNVEALHVLVESDDVEAAGAVADAVGAAARTLRDPGGRPLAASVLDRVDASWFAVRAPAWMPSGTLAAALDDPAVAAALADPAPHRALAAVRSRLQHASEAGDAAAGMDVARAAASLSALLRSMAEAAVEVTPGESRGAVERWLVQEIAGARGLAPTQHVSAGPGRLVVTIQPADVSNDAARLAPLVEGVRAAADAAVAGAASRVEVAMTGAPALVVDEMTAVRRDIAIASASSFVLVTLLFLVSFDSFRHVAFAAVANAAGLALTFGAAWALVGYLNLFSSVFAAVLAGLGIDFGIHLVHRYESRQRTGEPPREALVAAVRDALPPVGISAVTTSAAFLTVMTSEFDGFAQLGLISGVGVLLCLATAFTLLPALLAWRSARSGHDALRAQSSHPWSKPLLGWPVRHARAVAAAGLVLVAASAWAASRLRFDHDLMNLQPGDTEAVELQRDPERRVSTHLGMSVARDVEEARALAERYRALPTVASARSAADVVPPHDAERSDQLDRLARLVRQAPSSDGQGEPLVPPARDEARALAATLQEFQDLAFEGGDERAVEALDVLLGSVEALEAAIEQPTAEAGLAAWRAGARDVLDRMAAVLPDVASRGIRPEEIPPALAAQFVGRDGALAVLVEPRGSVWDRAFLERFVADMRAVDPAVTGPPVQVLEITEAMRVSLVRAAAYAFAVIVVFVALATRSVRGTLLSLFPIVAGFVLMLGAMVACGVPLNPANLVALPLLLGIGVDAGVHVVHRWREVGDARTAVDDVGHALLITSLTTVAGFVPLLLASHRGIRSLGQATCLGSLGMLIAAVVLTPALLGVIDLARGRRLRARDGAGP